MKGIYGLLVAVALGVAGGLLNYTYLDNRASQFDKVAYIGVKADAVVNRGDKLREDQLEPVFVPRTYTNKMDEYADHWENRRAVVDRPVWRTLAGPRLLLKDDIKTIVQEQLSLGEGEKARFISVDSRSFIASLIAPGDWVSFLVPTAPTPARPPEQLNPNDPIPATPDQPGSKPKAVAPDAGIGPFKVLSVGSRLASAEAWRAQKIPQSNENVLTIRVSKNEPGEEERATKLFKATELTNFRPVAVQLDRQGGTRTAQP